MYPLSTYSEYSIKFIIVMMIVTLLMPKIGITFVGALIATRFIGEIQVSVSERDKRMF